MGIFCREIALASKLKSLGFSPVALPQESLDPLVILKVEGGHLTRFGDLKSELDLHDITFNKRNVTELEGFKTSSVSVNASNRYLKGMAKHIVDGNLNTKLVQKENISYILSNVKMWSLDQSYIAELINESMRLFENKFLLKSLLSNELYIVTDVLKSNRVILSNEYSADTSLKDSVNNNDILINEKDTDKQVFDSTTLITFAIKAYKMVFEDQELVSFKKSKMTYRSGDAENLLANNFSNRYWDVSE